MSHPRMSLLLQCFLFVGVKAALVNAVAQIDIAQELTQCPSDGNTTTAAVICTVDGHMDIIRNNKNIAHWRANSVPGQVDIFNTGEDRIVKTVVLSAFNGTSYNFSALTIWPVKVGANGLGNVICRSETKNDTRMFSTTWNSGPSESCKTNGRMKLSFGCYDATACVFSCGDNVSLVSLNGRILSEDPASTLYFECYHGNNSCFSEVRDFVIIKHGKAIGMSKPGVLRCDGPDGYVEVNMGEDTASTVMPVSMPSTPTPATEKSGGRATGVNLAVTIVFAAVSVGGWM